MLFIFELTVWVKLMTYQWVLILIFLVLCYLTCVVIALLEL